MTQSQFRRNTIYKQDCLKFLKSVPNEFVDLVFTDPPYNVKKDYGEYKDNKSPEEYKQWMFEIVAECRRISKNGIIFYVGSKLTRLFFELIPDAHLIVVHQRAAGTFQGNYITQYHSMFSTTTPVKKCKDLWNDVRIPGEGYFFREPRYEHPGLTSLELTKKVLENFSKDADLVCDPFMGVGTTAVSCKEMNRDYIGSELNPKYIKIAKQRLCLA